ncbi:hypothetical protein GP486_005003 [Trichoglossum hirsutum]|uniref:GPI transamidase component PIG-T n=1 Tax=Trichoglossum hirsutum TaxID=265104 RepID=A0A9P8LA82_9PEZI|nr:hypothetical protein GP486_005003 [Trichoglossum hirsutum]
MIVAIAILAALLLWAAGSRANVEKAIFLGPSSTLIPQEHPSLDHLHLASLSPRSPHLRTKLHAAPPRGGAAAKGEVAWFLLDGLRAGQRYELRICWPATLYPHTLPAVFESSDLITSLASFSESRQTLPRAAEAVEPAPRRAVEPELGTVPSSILFLQVFAAADYFTSDVSLMQAAPPVDVDIILDPYLFNIFPRSLLPTAVYIAILAVVAWFLSDLVWHYLNHLAQAEEPAKKRKKEL